LCSLFPAGSSAGYIAIGPDLLSGAASGGGGTAELGGNDARVTQTVPTAAEQMKAAGKTYEPVTDEGAGHGFMRAGEAPDASAPNRRTRDQAWKRWKELLRKM
jgi:dienelactone hydrolase